MGFCTENVFSDNCWRESFFPSFISCSHLKNDCKNVNFKISKDLDILDNDSNLILYKKTPTTCSRRYIFSPSVVGLLQEALWTVIQIRSPVAKASEIKAPTKAALFVTYRLYSGFVGVTWLLLLNSGHVWLDELRASLC